MIVAKELIPKFVVVPAVLVCLNCAKSADKL